MILTDQGSRIRACSISGTVQVFMSKSGPGQEEPVLSTRGRSLHANKGKAIPSNPSTAFLCNRIP
eukprot:604697-Hanusia_phi.AAC.1